MSWYHQWSDGLKKRACRYLLQRYLGQFLEEKLSLDQLEVNVFNGTGSVSNVSLDVQALNDLGEKKNLPIEFVDGFLAEISVSIPWATLLTDSIFIEVSGLQITIQPRQRVDNGESMLESVWSSMASSMQLAAECFQQDSTLQDETVLENENTMEGVEIFAQTIESVLTRVKIKFIDTTLRLEHLPKGGKNGIAVEIRIKIIEYCDETSDEGNDSEDKKMPMFSIKKFHCDGICFYTDEFPVESRTFSRSVLLEESDMSRSCNKEKIEPVPILICKLSGVQEIRLKSKKLENITPGPKFDLDFSFGSLSLFLSPRQLHLLIEIVHSLSIPHIQDTSNVKYKKSGDKMLTSEDYKKIEQDLNDKLNLQGACNINKTVLGKGWVSNSMEESYEEFFPFGARCSQSASLYSNNTDMSWETSASTVYNSKADLHSYASSNLGMYHDKLEKGKSSDYELCGEITAFHLRLSSIAVVILHEDILTFGVDTYTLTPSSVSTLNNLSIQFFDQIGKGGIFGGSNKDFEFSKASFLNACNLDHIRIMGAAIIVEGKEGGSLYNRFCNTRISVANFELLECLIEPNSGKPEYVELLKFMKNSQECPIEAHYPISNQPDLKVYIVQNKKTRPSHISTKTEVTFSLQQCLCEIDLSLYDRLSSLLNGQPLCHTDFISKGFPKNTPFYEAFENTTIIDHHISLKIQCPFFVLKFRFPIPDLRPDIDKGRHPWWKRSIRKDVLYINLVDPIFQTEINYLGAFVDYNLQCSRITLLFQEGDSNVPVPFLYSAPKDANESVQHHFYEFPRLSIKLSSPKAIDEMEDNGEKDDANGLTCSFMETPIKEPSPFTSKRFVKSNPSDNASEGEEIITPSNKEDLNKFINDSLENSSIQIDVILPYIHVDFSSKHLYEVLYNRFSSDISLWQSSALKVTPINLSSDSDNIFPSGFIGKSFSLCKSGLQLGDFDDEFVHSGYHPTSLDQKPIYKFNQQSHLAFKIQINSGYLNICPNLKDSSGNIVPDKHGQLQFTLDKANIFSVNNYKGTLQKNYVCFQVENMRMMHQPVVENTHKNSDSYLKDIIYKSKEGMLHNKVDVSQTNTKPDMFTAAISSSIDSRRVKTICVACGINGATLRHYVSQSEHSWLTQLLDFFDVVDYPVKGYDSPQALTELHFNLEDSAVDYRPKYLKTQCVIYFGNFSIISSMSAKIKSSRLRFIAEETNLFISEKCSKHIDINLRNDYISVIDLGLFDLSLQLNDQPDLPKVDLRASSDILNIRTCVDSACSLAQLIKYYASNGDMNVIQQEEENQSTDPYLEKTSESDDTDPSSPSRGEVQGMMEDAMKEITSDIESVKVSDQEVNDEVEVFYFPDEGKKFEGKECVFDWAAGDIDSESEFCFVDHESAADYPNPNSPPIVRILTNDPIVIIDNYFTVSPGKIDHLLAPKHYPSPVYIYTLSDINVVWHMFGGNDFSCTTVAKKNISFDLTDNNKSSIEINTETDPFGVGYKKTCSAKYCKNGKNARNKRNKKWYVVGGQNRKHDVLMQLNFSKLRFQHEIYPEKTTQASRQVLLIHNFEICDKLKSSEINKFLYQYSSETKPLQSNANMIMVKAVHLRPDTRRDVQETCLKISMLPLRLNIDQDSIEFLIDFLYKLSVMNTKQNPKKGLSHHPSGKKYNPKCQLHDNYKDQQSNRTQTDEEMTSENISKSHSSPLYIKKFVFSPEVPIRIDYVGKRVDMSHGPMAGIIMGLGQLNCLQIKLKRLSYKHGLLGLDRLIKYACDEWIHDITKTQIPSLIGGVGPMHALFQLFAGIKDLFWLPIEQYQKDGRIFRGIQRGANSFTTSTVIAALELTARIVQAIQSIAEAAFDMVSPGPSVRRIHGTKSKKPHRYSHPADIREGVTNAYALVKEGLEETAETLVRVASAEAEQKGAVGAVGGVLRQLPPSMVAPIIIASAATSNLIGGVRNQLAPDSRREASFKWKNNET
ncbi:unnamed protein product [Nezara viridula]|uniref:Autophagy-related protein 2 n=1 Tax=Nezara viridula TaxID=85310 RepID=A0A9P0E5M5_NEZVI|nr:unnamed protein product [Nezara viridula]